jgi:macrophage erythroblast attacher
MKVRNEFRDTFLGIYALPSQSLLALSLSAGLSSLRLPACAPSSPPTTPKEERAPTHTQPLLTVPPAAELTGAPIATIGSLLEESRSRATPAPVPEMDEDEPPVPTHIANVDCPTCAEDMRVLAKEVPMAHHVNSTLVCAISGDVMDSNNEPMAFPNGSVYSSRALTEMAKNNFDVVTCPRTGETCAFSRLRKVYVS